jgi:hypothetical protein
MIVVASLFEWLVVAFGVIAALLAIVLAVRFSIWPGETAEDHPKRLIFKENR